MAIWSIKFCQAQDSITTDRIESVQLEAGGISIPYSLNGEILFDLDKPIKKCTFV